MILPCSSQYHALTVGQSGHSDNLGTWSAGPEDSVPPAMVCDACAAYQLSLQPIYITSLMFIQRFPPASLGAIMANSNTLPLIIQAQCATQIDLNPNSPTGQQTIAGVQACVSLGLLTQQQANAILAIT